MNNPFYQNQYEQQQGAYENNNYSYYNADGNAYYQNQNQNNYYQNNGYQNNQNYNQNYNQNNGGVAPAVPSYFDYKVPEDREEVNNFKGEMGWQVALLKSCFKEPLMCCCGCFCPCCTSFYVRKKLLVDDYNNYICCAGTFGGCCCCKFPCLKEPCVKNPTQPARSCASKGGICLCCETYWCTTCSVFSSRYMVRRHYNVILDPCEECLITFTCICTCLMQIAACLIGGDCGDLTDCVADCIWASVLGCMIAQTWHEMEVRGYPHDQLQGGPQAMAMS